MLRRVAIIFFLVLICVMTLLPLADVQAKSVNDSAELKSQQQETLSILWMIPPADYEEIVALVERFAREFEAENEGVTITVEFADWAVGRETILEAVNPPDIAMVGARWVPEFVSFGLIEPLDDFMTAGFRDQFVPSIINEGAVYQGRTFGLPVATSTRALYYNLDLFAAAGLENAPQTWDELSAAGKAINDLGQEGVYGFGLQGGDGLETNTYFYYFVWGNGGDLYNQSRTASALDSVQSIEALEYVVSLIEEGATQPEITAEVYARRRGLEDAFQQGKLGMMISGPWFINRLRTEAPDLRFGIAPIPYNTTPTTFGVMDALVILRTSRQKELAWRFLEFLYMPARRLEYTLTAGVLPELQVVAEDTAFIEDPAYAVFLSLLPDARFEPLHINSERISQEVIRAVRSVYLGEASPQEALAAVAESINMIMVASTSGW